MTGRVGFVLAGGSSRRMGRDKALVEVAGVPMVCRVADALRDAGMDPVVVGGDAALGEVAGATHIRDRWPGQGPLGGLVTALGRARRPVAVVVACDLPALDAPSIGRLTSALDGRPDAVVAVAHDGRCHWTCAAWRVETALPLLSAAFADGERAIHRAVEGAPVLQVAIASDVLRNVNGPEDLSHRGYATGGTTAPEDGR